MREIEREIGVRFQLNSREIAENWGQIPIKFWRYSQALKKENWGQIPIKFWRYSQALKNAFELQ